MTQRHAQLLQKQNEISHDTVLREGVSNDDVQFLQKPILPEALAGKVRNILDAAFVRVAHVNRLL